MWAYVVNLAVLISINAILAVTLNFILGYAGIFSIAHALFFGVGAYTATFVATKFGAGFLSATAAGMALTALISLALALPALRVRGEYFVAASLGLQMLAITVFTEWKSVTGGIGGLTNIPPARILGFEITRPEHFLALSLICLILIILIIRALVRSSFGRSLKAIRDDETAAWAYGKNVAVIKTTAVVLSSALAAVAVFLLLGGGAFALQNNATYAEIWPLNVQGQLPPDSYGIFYPYLPDLPIAQLMFLGGVAIAALAALGMPAGAGGRWLRGAAAALTAAGLAATGTAVGLAGTARLEAHGIVIPALHDAASDRPVRYTPMCSRSAVPVCVHPAYSRFLPAVTAALGPVLDQVAGLPGMPVRVTQVAVTSVQQRSSNGIAFGGPVTGGSPPVLYLSFAGISLPGEGGATTAQFIGQLQAQYAINILNVAIGGTQAVPGSQPAPGGPQAGRRRQPGSVHTVEGGAQVAIATALAQVAGIPSGDLGPTADLTLPAAEAAHRFTQLSASARHTWLVTHLAALRAGRITVSEIP